MMIHRLTFATINIAGLPSLRRFNRLMSTPTGLLTLRNIPKHHKYRSCLSQRRLTDLANTEEHISSEPEYLALVTQTAEKIRQSVREYVVEYSQRSKGNSSQDKNTMLKYNQPDDVPCISTPPRIKLVGILATTSAHNSCEDNTDTHGNERYSEQISAICAADGILYEPWRVPPTKDAMERSIQHANERLDVHGILVFYPVSDKLTDTESSSRGPNKCNVTGVYYKSMDDYFRDLVFPQKDVEGYHRKALRVKNLESRDEYEANNKPLPSCASSTKDNTTTETIECPYGPIYPCTALAVFRILETFLNKNRVISTNWINKKCFAFANVTMTIINRSEVLGLPLATMLSNQAAVVYSVDKNSILKFQPDGKIRREPSTTTIEQCVRKSSVIISAVPSEGFIIPTDWISNGSIVINVANVSNFQEETLLTAKEGIIYVPHVGRVTVAALESNLICLHKNYH